MSHIRAHLAGCREVRAMLAAWAKQRFRGTGPTEYGPWSCYFLPPHHRPECTAGKNGYVRFRMSLA